MSLRARLLVVLAGLAIVGLLAADVATYAALRSFLVERVDHTVDGSAGFIAHRGLDRGELFQLGAANPGLYLGVIDDGGHRFLSAAWTIGRLVHQRPVARQIRASTPT